MAEREGLRFDGEGALAAELGLEELPHRRRRGRPVQPVGGSDELLGDVFAAVQKQTGNRLVDNRQQDAADPGAMSGVLSIELRARGDHGGGRRRLAQLLRSDRARVDAALPQLHRARGAGHPDLVQPILARHYQPASAAESRKRGRHEHYFVAGSAESTSAHSDSVC